MTDKSTKTKHYKSDFKFAENQLDYEIKLKKRKKWWLWLLPLLLLLLLFVKCNKNIALQVVDDETNLPVANATIDYSYEKTNGKTVEKSVQSDEKGNVFITNVPQDVILSVMTTKDGYADDMRVANVPAFLEDEDLRIIRLKHKITYSNLDLIMCVDCTSSMGNVLDIVKKHALDFWPDLTIRMKERRKEVENFRIKIIAFRDYKSDGKDAMEETPFYTIPEQEITYNNYISGLIPKGGGDDPENGLEAIALAINSDWLKPQDESYRHVIMVWTDASAHELKGPTSSNYPVDMPQNMDELQMMWNEKLKLSSKRLLMFAPEVYPWNIIHIEWNNAFLFPFMRGAGIEDDTYESIIESIADFI